MMRQWLWAVGVMALALGLGVAGISPAVAQEECNGTYFVIAHSGPGDPFWAVVQRGVQEAGRRLGVQAVFQGPERFSPPQQANFVDAAVSARACGIATTGADPTVIRGPIERAIAAGIPVVIIDTDIPAEFRIDFPRFLDGSQLVYIGANEFEAGKNIAMRLVPLLPQGAKVVVVNQEPGNSALELRTQGISEVIAGELGGTTERLDITQDPTRAVEILRSFLRANPDTAAIFTLGPLGTIPTVRLLDELNTPPEQIRVGVFDLDEVTLDAIQRGRVVATVDAQPFLTGFEAVKQLVLFSRFKLSPTDINTARGLVDGSNVEAVADLVIQGIR